MNSSCELFYNKILKNKSRNKSTHFYLGIFVVLSFILTFICEFALRIIAWCDGDIAKSLQGFK